MDYFCSFTMNKNRNELKHVEIQGIIIDKGLEHRKEMDKLKFDSTVHDTNFKTLNPTCVSDKEWIWEIEDDEMKYTITWYIKGEENEYI